ncbi:MAG: DNA translocase FtsK [Saprospiraceae bacterium]|nr:DNA translocase FtsK [Saprospiraceae bacterium]
MTSVKSKNTIKKISGSAKDERVPKLIGIFILVIAAYLLIAFTSYLFTWYIDQDQVLEFSWDLLFLSDAEIANKLGRLGALVSNMFFYWGFGLPSFLFIYALGVIGWSMLQRRPLDSYFPLVRTTIIVVLLISVFLEFIFGDAGFPWGGAFGEGVSIWLSQLVGKAGLAVLFASIGLGLIVWYMNPDFEEMTATDAFKNTMKIFKEMWNGDFHSFQKVQEERSKKSTSIPNTNKIQKGQSVEEEHDELWDVENKLPFDAKTAKASNPTLEPKSIRLENGVELDFDIPESNKNKSKSEITEPAKPTFEIHIPPNEDSTKTESAEVKIPEIMPSESLMPLDGEMSEIMSEIDEDNPYYQNMSEPYDPKLELSSYEFPVSMLLNDYSDPNIEVDRAELNANIEQITATLLQYKIEITKIRATVGPTVTLYEIVPAPGIRISRIKSLEDDIALSLAALGIRIIAPIPGKGTIGIEVPNKNKQVVGLKDVINSDKFKKATMDLPIVLGKTISNEVFVADLAKMPHLLIAGATGQGKSVGINTVLMSILYRKHPSEVKIVMIDPKKVELFPYSRLNNHFLAFLPDQEEPIITDTAKVINTLNSLCIEMDDRYSLLKIAHARNIKEYNEKFTQRRLNPNKGHKFLPFIVLVIDEFADLIMTAGKEVELPIGRLAQLARAVGIHLIIATQRPSVNIITGIIKANFPARLAFKVTSKVDSRTILDSGGADQLIGRGDMLLSVGSDIIRLQCAFVDTPEVERVIDFIANQRGFIEPYFLPEYINANDASNNTKVDVNDLDEMLEDAARLVVQSQLGSTSMIQRRLKLGFNRAGRIMDQLESLGIVGSNAGSKPREVLISTDSELERYLKDMKLRK